MRYKASHIVIFCFLISSVATHADDLGPCPIILSSFNGTKLEQFKKLYRNSNPPANDPFRDTNILFFETDDEWQKAKGQYNRLVVYIKKLSKDRYDFGTYTEKTSTHREAFWTDSLKGARGIHAARMKQDPLNGNLIFEHIRNHKKEVKPKILFDPYTMTGLYYFTPGDTLPFWRMKPYMQMPIRLVH